MHGATLKIKDIPVCLRSLCWYKHIFTFGIVAYIRNQIISI